MSKKPVVIYGVTGYTGRLVAEYCREYHLPFIAAGRDAKRIKEVMDKVPGIENADYEIAEVEHTTEAPQAMAHTWVSGWVPLALTALSTDGAKLPAGP